LSPTTRFAISALTSTITVTTILLVNRSRELARKMAHGFYILCLVLSVTTFAIELLVISGRVSTQGFYGSLFYTLQYRAWIVVGVSIASTALLLHDSYGRPHGAAVQTFTKSPFVLKGLCLAVSFSFFDTEIGKLANDAIMRQFFLESGYAVWFMYSIMTLETLGALALFVPSMIIPVASVLAALMLGAIFTHYRNGDSFSDSLEALHLLIILVCILSISGLRSHSGQPKAAELN
jgi:uncharacterized membrane protein YphA (DoxX/SURF4 family)